MISDFSRILSGGRAGFPKVLEALEAHLDACGVPASAIAPVMIAADELISNTLDHGAQEGDPPTVEVSASLTDGRICMQLIDNGIAFNPLERAIPDTGLAVEDRAIGGLGIHLVRTLMDTVAYDRVDGLNRLCFSKAYSSHSPSN